MRTSEEVADDCEVPESVVCQPCPVLVHAPDSDPDSDRAIRSDYPTASTSNGAQSERRARQLVVGPAVGGLHATRRRLAQSHS
jgi:hypothetical protein